MFHLFIFFKTQYVLYCRVFVLRKNFHFVYPSGKPMSHHLLRCQGFAVGNYSFTLGRLTERSGDPITGKAGVTSTFAQLGLIQRKNPLCAKNIQAGPAELF